MSASTSKKARAALYSAVDDRLTHYDVDVAAATLAVGRSVQMLAKVQYVWPHPKGGFLYIATSSGGAGVQSDHNHVSAFTIAPDGTLHPHGTPRPTARRAVHICVDPAGKYVICAHNFNGGGMTVHRIEADGTLGASVLQDGALECGNYPHQVMVFPAGRAVLISDRGIDAQPDKPEAPGALRTFGLEDGILSPGQAIAPGGGYGFGPRHVAFHPTRPWMYVSDERTNRLHMFVCPDGHIEPEPSYIRDTLAAPSNVRPRQLGGPIHVHPGGRFVYVVNRSDHSIDSGGGNLFQGGENNIAVFAIDPDTGEPALIQHAPTHSFHVRTFAVDPSGRLLVAASIMALSVAEENRIRRVPAALSVFRVGEDGALSFVRSYDVETAGTQRQYWAGMIGLT